jgi:adenylate kinase
MTRMLIVGAPGSGKGTQTERISRYLEIPAISTGDIFRANVHDRTALGIEAQKYLDNGDLVPDGVTNAMVRDRLMKDDAGSGFLLDGYPRTLGQVAELDAILEDSGQRLDVVLQLTADDDELTRRLLMRAQETGRSDDTEEVITHRLELYRRQTEPVVDSYRSRDVLVQVNGIGAVDNVTGRILCAIERQMGPEQVLLQGAPALSL